MNSPIPFPRDFLAAGWNIGIKDNSLDFGVLHSKVPASVGAIFTRNNFPGHPVTVGREHTADGRLQTIVVNSKNANVATGPSGLDAAYNMCRWTASALGIEANLVLPSSTGVIGRPLPVERIQAGCREIPKKLSTDGFMDFAHAIMTTDTRPKLRQAQLESSILIAGFAKGAGMIEPNMATMLSYLITDAKMESEDLQRLVRSVANRSFNRVSVDSDTSTSDTFVAMANGASNKSVGFSSKAAQYYDSLPDPFAVNALTMCPDLSQDDLAFLCAFQDICRELAIEIAKDGEGATKLIELRIEEAKNKEQALKIGRSVINSPLVKTAIYGADPNWGRLLMAVGKTFDEPVPIEKLRIFFGPHPLKDADDTALARLADYLKNDRVVIRILLGIGEASETLWGCDLTEGYIHVNAHYTT